MEQNAKETQDATRWFIGAGLVAIIFSFCLFRADEYLSNSKGEQILRDTLFELRSAQTSLPSRVTDERQIGMAEGEIAAESK